MFLEMLRLSDVAYVIIITDAWPTISVFAAILRLDIYI